jgi:hypothetical protein
MLVRKLKKSATKYFYSNRKDGNLTYYRNDEEFALTEDRSPEEIRQRKQVFLEENIMYSNEIKRRRDLACDDQKKDFYDKLLKERLGDLEGIMNMIVP